MVKVAEEKKKADQDSATEKKDEEKQAAEENEAKRQTKAMVPHMYTAGEKAAEERHNAARPEEAVAYPHSYAHVQINLYIYI